MEPLSRVVALIDMDCFYCACERSLRPELRGRPLVVVQYNPYQGDGTAGESGVKSIPAEPAVARTAVSEGKVLLKSAVNGSIIAVSYEARERGVTRFMRGREAWEKCPELTIVQVPTAHGKSDMGVYRSYGAKVRQVVAEICGASAKMEKASVDEIYVDITLPARTLLAQCGLESLAAEAGSVGTHVAGAAEGAGEAAMGQQVSGPIGRSAFRAGHAGQRERAMDDRSCCWWDRSSANWPADDALLAAGAAIVARARAAVTERLGFTCSAGIASNKMLAKLCGGLHKPNQQTLLPPSSVAELLEPLPVDRLRGFGGKLGELLKQGRPELGILGFESVGQLRKAGVSVVQQVLQGEWSHPEDKAITAVRMASGRDDAPVEERPHSKQIGCGKNFSGSRDGSRRPLDTPAELEGWVREFAEEVWSRLEEEEELNDRVATQLVVSARVGREATSRSKRCKLRPGVDAITSDAMKMLRNLTAEQPASSLAVSSLGLSADNLVCGGAGQRGALKRMFQNGITNAPAPKRAESCVSQHADAPVEQASSKRSCTVVVDIIDDSLDASSAVVAETPVDSAQRWSCSICTLFNRPDARICDACSTPRGASSCPNLATFVGAADSDLRQATSQAASQPCRRANGGILRFLRK